MSARWSATNLEHLHIIVTPTPPSEFFPSTSRPSSAHPAIDLALASTSPPNFLTAALPAPPNTHWEVQPRIPFTQSAELTFATPALALYSDTDGLIKLVVRVDTSAPSPAVHGHTHDDESASERAKESFDPEPPVIGDALAAFAFNDHRLRHALHRPGLSTEVMHAITLDGAVPTFYRVHATKALCEAIKHGQKVEAGTKIVVERCILELEDGEGEEVKGRSERILAALEAFREGI